MSDNKYCYPNSNVLINKLGLKDANELYRAEADLTLLRLQELEQQPIKGHFDFAHLQVIHKYIFQDVYEWAGHVRMVEISKGNSWFCTLACLESYAASVFANYYPQCKKAQSNHDTFCKVLATNYGDLNALHPFREGNGRTQREFARYVCLNCGYVFDLSSTSHNEMLHASILSMEHGDNSELSSIFSHCVIPISQYHTKPNDHGLNILSTDDLELPFSEETPNRYENNQRLVRQYTAYYQDKVKQMRRKH